MRIRKNQNKASLDNNQKSYEYNKIDWNINTKNIQ